MLTTMTFMSPFYTSQADDQHTSKPLGTYQLTTDLFSEKATHISAILSSNDEAAAFLTAKIVSRRLLAPLRHLETSCPSSATTSYPFPDLRQYS